MKYDILVSGYGAIAQRHINNLNNLGIIKSLTIVKKVMLEDQPNYKFPVAIYTDFKQAINERHFDIAIIASPASAHSDQLHQLSNLKIGCLVEKPITLNGHQAQELYQFTRLKNMNCIIGYDLIYTKGFTEVSRILHSECLGKIWHINISVGQFLPDWRPSKNYKTTVSAVKALGGGALRELSHELDYLLALFNVSNIEFSAQLVRHSILAMDCENEANIFGGLSLRSQAEKVSFSIHLDMLKRFPSRYLYIEGAKGSLTWDLIRQKVTYNSCGEELKEIDVREDSNQPYVKLIQTLISQSANSVTSKQALLRSVQVMSWIDSIEEAASNKCQVSFSLREFNG
ncbi:Gfo/Idh/MocA family oxidoreductase [Pseudoalteromonas piscicida]|uniref:Gfo/Idh/MocA family protein n=1 Tax=Pseudoalteromonas TaxID=53246 RepID=UPI001572633F|nr:MULTISPECIES: Gfo/Idh/MocA family oxidoreductase [Pseudoalteromonas]MCG7552488.1 Gfo/Idh/MocA family oxidoreductase [Pseudoalteromonas sp. Of11M-6]NSY32143.1 gfo/Idh/MocA family oxidoreductase [Pseudoalteromonas sp. JC28]UDM62200.1 Gfo/Idh/MocA family oxidoreductase [Pseudoalteromonas piscicida]